MEFWAGPIGDQALGVFLTEGAVEVSNRSMKLSTIKGTLQRCNYGFPLWANSGHVRFALSGFRLKAETWA